MTFGPACERCGGCSYDGGDENPRCPWCCRYKRRGSRKEMAEHIQLLRRALEPCLSLLRHKEIRPPMDPGVQERMEKEVAHALKETE